MWLRLALGLSLVLAAVGAVLLLRPAAPPPPTARPIPTPPGTVVLPAYVMAIANGGAVEPGTALPNGQLPVVLDGNELLDVVVRPERKVTASVDHWYFWVKGAQTRRWTAVPQPAPSSAFRTRGTAEKPFGPGLGELVAVISPLKDIPETIAAATLASPPAHWQVLHQAIKWR
jgi:hypothetical protein